MAVSVPVNHVFSCFPVNLPGLIRIVDINTDTILADIKGLAYRDGAVYAPSRNRFGRRITTAVTSPSISHRAHNLCDDLRLAARWNFLPATARACLCQFHSGPEWRGATSRPRRPRPVYKLDGCTGGFRPCLCEKPSWAWIHPCGNRQWLMCLLVSIRGKERLAPQRSRARCCVLRAARQLVLHSCGGDGVLGHLVVAESRPFGANVVRFKPKPGSGLEHS